MVGAISLGPTPDCKPPAPTIRCLIPSYQYFRQGLTKDKCRVHFDGRKAVITFARGDVNNTTILSSLDFNMNSFASGLPDNMDILHDVYVAMKLKSLPKEDLKLKVN